MLPFLHISFHHCYHKPYWTGSFFTFDSRSSHFLRSFLAALFGVEDVYMSDWWSSISLRSGVVVLDEHLISLARRFRIFVLDMVSFGGISL